MSKYLVTSSSYFEPFTYDELIKPVMIAQQAHDATQEAYDKMSMETSALENYISKDGKDDALAREMYQNYKAKLDTLQNNLWNKGINAMTKRDLSSARSAYASDILRLQKAVETRQQRSKEFWEARHKDPSLVTAADPGLAGLDNYLMNDRYGQDYYSYSGDQFTKEVAIDAQARASEMLRDPEVMKNPDLVGYLTIKKTDGFTSEEVRNATAAVRLAINGNTDGLSNLTTAEGILADVLMSHLNSSGAKGKISNDEFNRLFEYGASGLSQAIGKTTIDEKSDKVWDFNKQLAATRYAHSLSNQTPPPQAENGYNWSSLISNLTSPGYEGLVKSTRSVDKKYDNGKQVIVNPDGTPSDISSSWEMASKVFNPEIRKKTRRIFGGLDVAMSLDDMKDIANDAKKNKKQLSYSIKTKGGDTYQIVPDKLSDKDAKALGYDNNNGLIGIYDKYGRLLPEATKKFNAARKEYNDHVKAYRDSNPNMDLDDYAITPKKEKELRSKYNIDNIVDSGDIYSIVTSEEKQGDYSPADLVGVGSGFDYARENYGRLIANSLGNAISNSGGNVGKGDRFAVHKIGKGGMTVDPTGETDKSKVFITDKEGNIDPKGIKYISFFPEDIAKGAGNGRPVFRFSTNKSDNIWQGDALMLGDKTWNALKSRNRYPNGWSACDAVDYMMKPIDETNEVLAMDDKSSAMLGRVIYELLNDTSKPATKINGPVIYDEAGNPHLATAKDIARSRYLQDQLYAAITDYINKIVSTPRDMMNIQHPQNVGNSSQNAPYYLPR